MKGLTKKQSKFFRYILDYAKEHGVFPTYQTIIDETWVTAKNGVYQYLQALYEKNYLQSIEWGGYELHPSKRYLINDVENPIPIKGIISAGVMQEAVQSDLGSLSIRDLFPQTKSPFSLRVVGKSMKEVGIFDGDMVILDDQPLKNGDIGAILYNDETTLKEIHFGNKVVLYPKNRQYEPIEIQPKEFEQVTVLGKYIAHFHEGEVHYIR